METFKNISLDPWQWIDLGIDDVMQLMIQSTDTGPTAPIFQYAAVRACNAERTAVESGDGFAVLACIRVCGTHGLVMPDWLVSAFNQRYDAVLNCQAASWDDAQAFGTPYPKGSNLNSLRKRRTGRLRMWLEVNRAVNAGESVNKMLFERLGDPYGYGKTLAEELYREALRLPGLFDPVKARREKKSAQDETVMHMSAAAAIARETGRDRIKFANDQHLMYHNEGPIRVPLPSRTRTD